MTVNELYELLSKIKLDPQQASAQVTLNGKELKGINVLRELDNKGKDKVRVTIAVPSPMRTGRSLSRSGSRFRSISNYPL